MPTNIGKLCICTIYDSYHTNGVDVMQIENIRHIHYVLVDMKTSQEHKFIHNDFPGPRSKLQSNNSWWHSEREQNIFFCFFA